MINHIKISKDFWLDEYQCKGKDCCNNLVKIESELAILVQKLRKQVKKPLTVTSAYRCPTHNHDVGGQPHSLHLSGRAVDVTVTKFDIRELARLAFSVGFRTVIAYPHRGFVHLDVRRKGLGLVGG